MTTSYKSWNQTLTKFSHRLLKKQEKDTTITTITTATFKYNRNTHHWRQCEVVLFHCVCVCVTLSRMFITSFDGKVPYVFRFLVIFLQWASQFAAAQPYHCQNVPFTSELLLLLMHSKKNPSHMVILKQNSANVCFCSYNIDFAKFMYFFRKNSRIQTHKPNEKELDVFGLNWKYSATVHFSDVCNYCAQNSTYKRHQMRMNFKRRPRAT